MYTICGDLWLTAKLKHVWGELTEDPAEKQQPETKQTEQSSAAHRKGDSWELELDMITACYIKNHFREIKQNPKSLQSIIHNVWFSI